jgi:nitrous oxidase accessory protein NosD
VKVVRRRAATAVWTAFAFAAALAVSSHWLKNLRLAAPELSAVRMYRVTTGADSGPGSLREGILAADRTEGRARVVIDVARITLETPLPPLVNPAGVVIEASASRAVIDASRLEGGAVLDVLAPDCVIVGLRIEHAPAEAILLRRGRARLLNIAVADSEVGVYQVDGAADLIVEGSTFERNTVGAHIAADGAPVKLVNNTFANHRRAGVWSVAAVPFPPTHAAAIDLLRNRFAGDYQPVILFNVQARLDANTFADAHAAAVYVHGARVAITNNRIRAGRNFGIYAEQSDHALIEHNEVDHNCAGGMIVRDSRDTVVSANHVYANGYGVILVEGDSVSPNTVTGNLIAQHTEDGLYVIGSSPMLRHNRLLQNRKAGLRLSSLESSGRARLIADPLLDTNLISGNGRDDVQRDEYSTAAEGMRTEPADCSWRLMTDSRATAGAGGKS